MSEPGYRAHTPGELPTAAVDQVPGLLEGEYQGGGHQVLEVCEGE